MSEDPEMILNPLTRRKVRVGSAVHKRLVKSGHLPSGGGADPPKCRSLKQKRTAPAVAEPEVSEEPGQAQDAEFDDWGDTDPFYDKKTRNKSKEKGLSPDIEALVDMIIDTVIANRKSIGDMSIGGKTVAEALKRAIVEG